MKTRWVLPTKRGTRLLGLVVVTALVLLNTGSVFADVSTINVSGYETFPGLPCKIDGEDSWCAVSFHGWFGGGGAVPGGWVSYTGQGVVVVRVNYTGQPDFGSTVTITGGTWRLADHNSLYRGTISSGTVSWPMPAKDIGCGAGIATVEANLADSEFSQFVGCLHDFAADDQVVIPPKIWGVFQ
jgi:hypothetical protein